MITAVHDTWKERVLVMGSLDFPSQEGWETEAYAQYCDKLSAPRYPCFFGQTAEARAEMLYTFVPRSTPGELLRNVATFVDLIGKPAHQRASLAAFFEPDPTLTSHAEFVRRFWTALQYLHDHDPRSRHSPTPDDPLWEFSFADCEMFVVGTSPTYRKRSSRNLGPGMVLIFQPRHLFLDPATSQPIAQEVRHRIHKRMLAYDGMTVHPDIGFYGEPRNREWKQYALPDDNEPEAGVCPFHQ